MALSQQELSDMLGISRQSVNQALRQLVTKGLIQTRYSGITLLDWTALESLVSEEL